MCLLKHVNFVDIHLIDESFIMIALNFSSAIPNTVLDKDNQGTGFTSVQPNKNGNQYDPSRIDLDPLTGTLELTATKGSSANNDNTLKNALQVGLDATEPFIISTRLPRSV